MTEEQKVTLKLPKINAWMISTFVLIIILGIFLAFPSFILNLTGRATEVNVGSIGSELTPDEAGSKAVEYINKNLITSGSASLVSVEEMSDMYKVTTSYQGQQIPVYITKDGLYLFISQPLDTTKELPKPQQQQTQQEIPKSDRPKVELYIFSYCPFGAQSLDSFAEVALFLKDYADFKVKFFSNMHGEHERQQNMIQECIQKVAPDKYFEYAKDYYEKVYSSCASQRSVDCDKEKTTELLNEVGIDSNKVFECVEKEGEQLYQQDKNDASSLGLSGSPSFVINGVYTRVTRTPEGIKSAVCSAFNTPPEKCSQELSSSASSSSGQC